MNHSRRTMNPLIAVLAVGLDTAARARVNFQADQNPASMLLSIEGDLFTCSIDVAAPAAHRYEKGIGGKSNLNCALDFDGENAGGTSNFGRNNLVDAIAPLKNRKESGVSRATVLQINDDHAQHAGGTGTLARSTVKTTCAGKANCKKTDCQVKAGHYEGAGVANLTN